MTHKVTVFIAKQELKIKPQRLLCSRSLHGSPLKDCAPKATIWATDQPKTCSAGNQLNPRPNLWDWSEYTLQWVIALFTGSLKQCYHQFTWLWPHKVWKSSQETAYQRFGIEQEPLLQWVITLFAGWIKQCNHQALICLAVVVLCYHEQAIMKHDTLEVPWKWRDSWHKKFKSRP